MPSQNGILHLCDVFGMFNGVRFFQTLKTETNYRFGSNGARG